MNQPRRFLNRMSIFVLVVLALGAFLAGPLKSAFLANAGLNGVILATLLLGTIFVFRQVLMLRGEIAWVEALQNGAPEPEAGPRLLAPMKALLAERSSTQKLSALSMRSLLDSIAARLDEGREISRYLIGLLIFLGLLGTFWGLLGTIASISGTINSLTVESTDIATMFDSLKAGLNAPLSGMATAFSSSLFGLAGSVALGFLDLQAGQAQSRFYNDLEEWLSSVSRLTSAGAVETTGEGGGTPAYIGALLEQTADSLDKLERVISKSEDGRKKTNETLAKLAEQQALLGDQLKASQDLMLKLAEGQGNMANALKSMADDSRGGDMLDEATKAHLRNMDVHINQLVRESGEGREKMVDDLRSEIKLLARTLSAALDKTREG